MPNEKLTITKLRRKLAKYPFKRTLENAAFSLDMLPPDGKKSHIRTSLISQAYSYSRDCPEKRMTFHDMRITKRREYDWAIESLYKAITEFGITIRY